MSILHIVMEYNAKKTGDKYKYIAEAMGINTSGMSQEEYRKAAVEAVKMLSGYPAWNKIYSLLTLFSFA